jgi:hypothetical protein
MNNELERMWKEVVVTLLEVSSQHLLGLKKPRKTSHNVVFVLVRIRTGNVRSQKNYRMSLFDRWLLR